MEEVIVCTGLIILQDFICIYVNNAIYTLKKFEDTKGVLRSLEMEDGTIQWPKKKDKKTNTCGLSNIENSG
jgi:hypothetical protein